MAKVRQDAWSHQDDLLLAETVLRHVREGSTQLNAFDEVGDHLNRTSAACGFRWNAEVRRKYESAMDLAKRQRKDNKRAMEPNINTQKVKQPRLSLGNYEIDHANSTLAIQDAPESPITMDHVIQFLTNMKQEYHDSDQSKAALDRMQQENKLLRSHVDTLEKQLVHTEKQFSTVQEDYQAFIQIMERARKMTVLDDQGSLQPPAFRMDKNGNLEQLTSRVNP